jgi:hypothetical protein
VHPRHIGEQTRALRIRSFVNFLQNHPHGGAYIQIGTDAKEKLRIYSRHNAIVSELLLRDSWTSTGDVARAAVYRTTLRRMTGADFDLLECHGYETAKWNLRLFLEPGRFIAGIIGAADPASKCESAGLDGGNQSAGLRSSCDSPLQRDGFETSVPGERAYGLNLCLSPYELPFSARRCSAWRARIR